MKESKNYIQRCPHDRENPYSQISRDLIRDQSISPNCRWLLVYLLSMTGTWKLEVEQIWDHVKDFIGRDKVYKIIDEAIEAGYVRRNILKSGNLNRGVEYFVSEFPKFKKCFRLPDFQDPEIQDAENQEAIRNSIYKEKAYVRNPPPLTPPKKIGPEPEMIYTEEEDIFFEMIMKERKGPAVRSVSRYKKAVILEKRSQDSSSHTSPQNMTKRIEMAKEVYEESIKHPERFIGKIFLDSLGILSCTGKGLNLLPLSPREPLKDWNSVVQSWKTMKGIDPS